MFKKLVRFIVEEVINALVERLEKEREKNADAEKIEPQPNEAGIKV